MTEEPTSGLSMMKPRPTAQEARDDTGSEETGEYPEVSLPPQYTPPDDAAVGDTWEATVKFKSKGDGKACLISVDGVPYEEKTEQEEGDEGDPAKAQPSMAEAAAAQRMQPGYASM